MRRLYSFLMATLDGFYEGPNQEFHFWTTDDELNLGAGEEPEPAPDVGRNNLPLDVTRMA